jgi:ATP-dependent Clp protease ATP-binding subunit ClpB
VEEAIETSRRQVMELLKKSMRPEFLNRIDEVVMFRPLAREHMEGIIRIQLGLLERTLKKQDITIEPSPDLVRYLEREGFDLQYGARPLKRLIQKKVVDALSVALLNGVVRPGMNIRIDVEGEKVVFHSGLKQKEAGMIPA